MIWEAGSPLKASGSFAHYHFELHNINPYFFLAFRAIERKLHKNSIFIHLCPGLAAAYRAAHPARTILFFVHRYHSSLIATVALRLTSGFNVAADLWDTLSQRTCPFSQCCCPRFARFPFVMSSPHQLLSQAHWSASQSPRTCRIYGRCL